MQWIEFIRRKISLILVAALVGCGGDSGSAPPPVQASGNPANLAHTDILSFAQIVGSSVQPLTAESRINAARNEWVSLILQINAPDRPLTLQLPAPSAGEKSIHQDNYRAYQLVSMPVDVNRAGYVRHTGLPAAVESMPRALLPLTVSAGKVELSQLRHPDHPTDPKSHGLGSGKPVLVWIDLLVPATTPAGEYRAGLTIADPAQPTPLASASLVLKVEDFVLPDDRHLVMVGDVPWESLNRFWPEKFEVIRPNLLSRRDPNHAPAVRTLDQMMAIAQSHRLQLFLPRLQPTVKWPPLLPPQIDWSDFDPLVEPWLNGKAFADGVPLAYWPLPKIDFLDNYAVGPRMEYYSAAASHFDQLDWLRRAPIILDKPTPGRATVEDRLNLSLEAQRVLTAYSRVRVMLPLEPDEVQIADATSPKLIDPAFTSRLTCAAPGLISSSPLKKWPDNLDKPQAWLRTDMRGLIPYVGAGGDAGDVRVWAWMAFHRNAQLIQWGSCLPSASLPNEPADPNELVWLYPGEWFGIDQPVQTIQLKWLRRAQQDFEYLYLASERGSRFKARPIWRILTKPVEIQPTQAPDPTYSLLIGTADTAAWNEGLALVSRIVMSQGPNVERDDNRVAELDQDTFAWIEPLEKPVIIPRTTQWTLGTPPPGKAGPWVNLKLGVDLYNPSDTTPEMNELRFGNPQPGWEVQPAPSMIPRLNEYQVVRASLNTRIDPGATRQAIHTPMDVRFKNRATARETPGAFVAPVVRVIRRNAPLRINGSLDEWVGDDAINLGPLVKMMARPSVQQHTIESASTKSEIYSGWSDTDLYLAFRVEGLGREREVLAARNFVDYQAGRAWGEDLCQIIAQAVYEDGSFGPLLHVALKPSGNVWVERQLDPRVNVNPWQNFNPGVRYASTLEQTIWRGEVAIPWSALVESSDAASTKTPVLVKFNFIQHKRDSGESASWAGPVDVGRDNSFTGVLLMKEPE